MEVALSRDQLLEALEEQLSFLAASAKSYDEGFHGEAKRLAVAVRVLVHDTAKSTSLLSLLGDKAGTAFLDTSLPVVEGNLISHSSLVQTAVRAGGSLILPLLDGGGAAHRRNIAFDPWWNGIVFVDQAKNEFSRKDVVLTLANKEGGAHVDEKLDARWNDLRKNNSLGWMEVNDGKSMPGADQVPATMRQIAHELLKTLKAGYVCEEPKVSADFYMMGASVVVGAQAPVFEQHNLPKNRPMVGGKKVGRNDSCPCGSGKKYKRCCIA